jgi:hypothetical protein
LAVLLGYVGGRALFWFITDMWADGKMFQWEGSGIKFRGLLAVGVGLACVAIIGDSRPIGQALAAMVGVLSFLGVFRLLGGVGDVIRASIAGLLGSRLGFVARFI